jgi:peptidoglycan/LPS O-acetylase OafA/YrhL
MFHGFRSVLVFFVLSGFLITTLSRREEERTGKLDIRGFIIWRVFRILPLFYLTWLAYVVWGFVLRMEPNGD